MLDDLRRVLSVAFVLMLGLAAGARAQEADARVVEAWSTGGPADAPFVVIAGMAEAPDGSIVISDSNHPALYRFDPETESFQVFDRKGKGPGELQTPTLAVGTSGGVAVYDLGHPSVMHYDSTLSPTRFIRLHAAVMNPKGFAYLEDGTIVISGGVMGQVGSGRQAFAVHRFSSEGERLEGYVPLAPARDPTALIHTAGGPLWALDRGGFLYSNSAPHRILAYDAEYREATIAADPEVLEPIVDRFSEPVMVDGRQLLRHRWFYDQSRLAIPVPGGRILNVITRKYEGDSIWEVWTEGGTLVRRVHVPRAYHPFGATRSGEILATYTDADTDEYIAVGLRLEGFP